MKILYITNGFPPHRWAGTETYTSGIAQGMLKSGHTVQVLCGGEWQIGSKYWNGLCDDEYHGVPVRRIDLNWTKASDPNQFLYRNPIIGEFLKQYLDEVGPDLVHITSCEILSASVIETVYDAGVPMVLSLTDFWFLCPRINLLRGDGNNCDGDTVSWDCLQCLFYNSEVYKLPSRILTESMVEKIFKTISRVPAFAKQRGFRGMALDIHDRKSYLRRIYSLPDVRLTASQFVKDIHLNVGFDDELEIHPYGHDLAWLQKYHGKLSSTRLRFGFIGQIIESKGVHLILEAAQLLYNDYGDKVEFKIYGNLNKVPTYGDRLLQVAEKVNNVEFCGTYERRDSANVYSSFDILIVPSIWYDFPLVIYEAHATQTPVLASNLGGMAEAVEHGISGLLFERGEVNDLANKIKRLVDEPNLIKQIKANIPPVKKLEDEILELEKIYENLIDINHKEKAV